MKENKCVQHIYTYAHRHKATIMTGREQRGPRNFHIEGEYSLFSLDLKRIIHAFHSRSSSSISRNVYIYNTFEPI